MLEKMSDFFEARIDGYDEHMLGAIEGAREFYPFTASQMPTFDACNILDLGCGTGLELRDFFHRNPSANVTAIDLSEKMLARLRQNFEDKNLNLICGSYFDVSFPENSFDAAISVESLHHFKKEEKVGLYTKLRSYLKKDGYFILTDYFAHSDEEELINMQNFEDLKTEQGIVGCELYHYDIPLTVKHEMDALYEAGFSSVEVLKSWGATSTIKAKI